MASKNRRVDDSRNHSTFRSALLVGILGGVLAVLVDIDHLPILWGGRASRTFHIPLFIAASLVAVYCFARLGGLLVEQVLSRRLASPKRKRRVVFRRYSYEDFNQDTKKLAELIQQISDVENKKFTKIYGIPRGGLMVAVRLSHLLGLPLVVREDEIDENTIVAEDIVSTGSTCKRLEERINFRHFLVVAIFYIRDSEYHGRDTLYIHGLDDNRNTWVVFPWETEYSTYT